MLWNIKRTTTLKKWFCKNFKLSRDLMQWLQFVNKLDCYKGKENKKQLLNIIKVLCSHNMVTLKDIRYLIKKTIIVILTTLFTGWGSARLPYFLIFSKLEAQTTYKTRNLYGCLDFFFFFISSYNIESAWGHLLEHFLQKPCLDILILVGKSMT